MREGFVFYRSFYEAIRDLPRDVQGEIYTAIMEYGLYGKETEQLKPIARSVFTLMKPLLDQNFARYENAKKGGAPKGNSNNPNGRKGKEQGKETNQELTENQPRTNQEPTKNQPKEKEEEKIKEKELSKESPKKKDFDFSFVSAEYLEAFQEWLDYKKARKETYKTQASLQKCYNNLIELSGNNPHIARRIIDQSIANNWAGLFELKQQGKASTQTKGESAPNGVKLGVGERIENGRRTYGSGRYDIPMDAPPRPREGTYWNDSNGQWVTG